MRKNLSSPLTRHPENPILTPDQMPFPCSAVYNAGATEYRGGVLLLLRVEDARRKTDFYVATSRDGVHFDVATKPIRYPLGETEKRLGGKPHRFDMRITRIGSGYIVCHAVWTSYGSCIGMARTRDFESFEPFPYLSVPSNRNAVLFPEKIGGLYARLERPQHIDGTGRTWISYSRDLEFWGRSLPVALPRTAWSERKDGPGAIPIRTPEGWLIIYHATCPTASTENYYLGVALLDLKDPSVVRAAPESFILAAEMPYECVGQVPNVVFSGGAVHMPDGTLNVYYGGADTRMCLATTTVDKLLQFCRNAPG